MIDKIISKVKRSGYVLAAASLGNPVISTLAVMIFYLAFSVLEGVIEELLFGQPFKHWLDPLFILLFMAYSAMCVYYCAVFNAQRENGDEE